MRCDLCGRHGHDRSAHPVIPVGYENILPVRAILDAQAIRCPCCGDPWPLGAEHECPPIETRPMLGILHALRRRTGRREHPFGVEPDHELSPPYLANTPTGSTLICLVVAVVCFAFGAIFAGVTRAWWQLVISAGLVFTALAFLTS